MKQLLLLLFFTCSYTLGHAQYGRLEPLSRNIDTIYVLRTPRKTIDSLESGKNKTDKQTGRYLEQIEHFLDLIRYDRTNNHTITINPAPIMPGLKFLESQGIDVSYYVNEILYYNPKREVKKKRKK